MSNKTSEENEQLSFLSDLDRNHFLDALERPGRPIPEPIRKAKSRHDELIASDNEKTESSQKQKLKGSFTHYEQPTEPVWPEEDS